MVDGSFNSITIGAEDVSHAERAEGGASDEGSQASLSLQGSLKSRRQFLAGTPLSGGMFCCCCSVPRGQTWFWQAVSFMTQAFTGMQAYAWRGLHASQSPYALW